MKRKVIIVSGILWVIGVVGGAFWERAQYFIKERSITPGQREMRRLKDLYEAKLYDETLQTCARDELDQNFAAYLPQILYVEWAAERKLGFSDQAAFVQRKFLQRFPDHMLAADMHYSIGMEMLASADYEHAVGELKLICERYAATSVAAKARNILIHLKAAIPATLPHGEGNQ